MRIALFQPEIAGNVGAVLRLAACLDVAVDLIEPMGFTWDDARVRRTAMDYIDHVAVTRHKGFDAFRETIGDARLILMTTKGGQSLYDATFRETDILLFGQESAGVPTEVAATCDLKLKIPSSQPSAPSTSPWPRVSLRPSYCGRPTHCRRAVHDRRFHFLRPIDRAHRPSWSADALRGAGHSVWLDEQLPAHRAYADEIAERLDAARAVVAIWSHAAVKSHWVQVRSRSGASRMELSSKLASMTLGCRCRSIRFNRINLCGWSGDTSAPGLANGPRQRRSPRWPFGGTAAVDRGKAHPAPNRSVGRRPALQGSQCLPRPRLFLRRDCRGNSRTPSPACPG